jgi:hypothetical protein
MELDGYCSDLKIAFEYNGKQHYDLVPIYHSGLIQTLQTRKRDDKFKVALCKKYGINLIVIPYSVKKDKIYDFIIKECKKRKIGIPEHKKDDYTKLNIYSANRFRLADMQLLALNHGGKCLSDKYIDIETKLKWQCSEGHVWELSPRRVKNGDWCIICNKKNRQRPPRDKTRWLNDVKEIAASRGGFCISDKYIGVMKKLKWKCAKGHVWETAPCTIKQGAWCPKCAGKQKHTIEEMHEIAKEHGGKCLSETYINSGTELTWQCAREHIWKATPKSVLISKSWCLECSGSKKLTIEAMQQIAKERDGKCLSTKYINAHTKLRWQCFKGHIWEAKPSDVKNGNNWCPSCANSRKGKKKRLAK